MNLDLAAQGACTAAHRAVRPPGTSWLLDGASGTRAPARLALSALLVLFSLALFAAEPNVPPDRAPLASVFALPRPAAADLLVLRTGERMTGRVLNETITFTTAYAELKLPTSALAGLALADGPAELASLVTVTRNRLTGFLSDPTLRFQPQDGAPLTIRREKVWKVVFGVRPGEPGATAPPFWIGLKDGDLLSGQVLEQALKLDTPEGTLSVRLDDLRLLAASNQPGVVSVRLRDGRTLHGSLVQEDLPCRLETGQELNLYRDRIRVISDSWANAATASSSNPIAFATNAPPGVLGASTNLQNFIWIPPGRFVMGTPSEEPGRDPDEGPLTKVTLPQGFWMDKYEVTQAEYQRVMGANPSTSAGDPRRPVEKVSWFEAMEYCNKLTRLAETQGWLPKRYVFRLPTEAEWEYACRAGTTTPFSYGEDEEGTRLEDYAWFTRNSSSTTHPVGAKKPNPWGLFDMHGNVWEWCLDRWEDGLPGGSITNVPAAARGSLRVARGGSWLYEPKACRSGNRDDYGPWDRCSDIGFRVVLAPLPSAVE